MNDVFLKLVEETSFQKWNPIAFFISGEQNALIDAE